MKINYKISPRALLLQKFKESKIQIQCSSLEERTELVKLFDTLNMKPASRGPDFTNPERRMIVNSELLPSPYTLGFCDKEVPNYKKYGHLPIIQAKELLDREEE